MSVNYDDDLDYAHNRLSETIVLYGDKPIYIAALDGRTALCRELPTQNRVDIPLSDLDLTPISLGYINEDKEAHYVMRIPARQWRQGLRSNQLSCPSGWNRTYNIYKSVGFYNSVINRFPSPSECYEGFINEEFQSKAFSKSFALIKTSRRDGGMNLAYKGRVVGTALMGDSRVVTTLVPKFSYLSELLEEERHGRP